MLPEPNRRTHLHAATLNMYNRCVVCCRITKNASSINTLIVYNVYRDVERKMKRFKLVVWHNCDKRWQPELITTQINKENEIFNKFNDWNVKILLFWWFAFAHVFLFNMHIMHRMRLVIRWNLSAVEWAGSAQIGMHRKSCAIAVASSSHFFDFQYNFVARTIRQRRVHIWYKLRHDLLNYDSMPLHKLQ